MSNVVVSVVIPTLDRPGPLRRALASALAQSADGVEIDILVVDNSRDGSARATVAPLMDQAAGRLRYLSVPEPGVANARNAGVAAATGRYVAFLDDDEEAEPGWLGAHVATITSTGADAVFGPVSARAEQGGTIGGFGPFFSRALDRPDRADISDLAAYLGTNNSMFDKARCFSGAEPFAVALNSVGGEDSLLLKRLVLSGRRFGWSAGAKVVEWVPERRLNWAYVRKRKFLSGQIRSFVLDMLDPPRRAELAVWMGVGAVQFAGGVAAAAALSVLDRERAEKARAGAYGGLGKLLWMKRFRPKLYGSGLVS
ncbi:glycosyltransferase [Methylopila sp. M107]|uniref:glycosyltransferase family 2 protein n=1 Tax=Methylopila sp. M107 TaxID=1101190 RepID=UPI0003707140|nr:glycosyltransferase [Methylopila sp. M107]